MRNNKLSLKTLKIKSFVTDIKMEKSLTIKGGATFDGTGICPGPAPTRNNGSWCICK